MKYLLFKMDGVMQAWGLPLAQETRATSDHPTKSGVVGYLGNCLGYYDSYKLREFCSQTGYACRVDDPGSIMTDFHTVSIPHEQFQCRGDYQNKELIAELRAKGIPDPLRQATVLSNREYLVGACFTVCIWSLNPKVSLEEVLEHIKDPVSQPFLGRKCCLSAPPEPTILSCNSLTKAFAAYRPVLGIRSKPGSKRFYWEGSDSTLVRERTETRYDTVAGDRVFAMRLEHTGRV